MSSNFNDLIPEAGKQAIKTGLKRADFAA